jgi:hypothetical protein
MTDLITTVNRTLTAKEFQGLADHERAAQAAEPIVWRHTYVSLAYVFVPLDFKLLFLIFLISIYNRSS